MLLLLVVFSFFFVFKEKVLPRLVTKDRADVRTALKREKIRSSQHFLEE